MNQAKINPTKISLPALGRQFSLGQLYDCRSEIVIRGKSLWSKDVTLKALTTRTKRHVAYDVLPDERFESKLRLLGIDNNLKASILGNLVSLSGSSKYLNDQSFSKQHDKVTLHYNCTTKTEELDIEKLSKERILCPDVFTNGIATHVVCGILYGGQAFFVFNNSLSTGHQESSASLHEAVKALPKIGLENGRLNMSQEIEAQTTGIGCRLYSDFRTPYYPNRYKDAAQLFNSLSHFVEGSGAQAVPVKVFLWPLSELDSFAADAVRQTSVNIVSQIEDAQNHLDKLVFDCSHMTGMPIITHFPGMKRDIEDFLQLLRSYKQHLQLQIGHIVTRIRTGSLEENALEAVLREKEESPFGRQQLDVWVQQKNVHLKILSQDYSIPNRYIPDSIIRHRTHSSSYSAKHSQPLAHNKESQRSFLNSSSPSVFVGKLSCSGNSHDSDTVVCFHVNMGRKNSLTKLMKDYLHYMNNGFLRKLVEVHRCNQSFESTLKKAEQFVEFVEANQFNDRLKFSFVEDNKVNGKPNVYVSVMKNGAVIHDNYQPPTAPGCAKLVRSVHNKLMIKWSAPKNGREWIKHYEVQFKEVNGSFSQIAQVNYAELSLEAKYTIQNLDLGKGYEIQVRAICDVGLSKWSLCSSFQTLPATVPGKPMASHQIPNNVLVQWSKPQKLASNIHLKSYIISVCDITTGEKFEKETNAQNGEDLTFSHLITTSSYTFTVKACYEEGETETSEISDVLKPKPNTVMKGTLLADSKKVGKSGNPPIYRLKLNHTLKKPNYKIRKCELGQSRDGITEKVIMVVGATGAGKTTLINGLVNYVLGVDWKDNFRFQLIVDVEESKKRSQAQSQTKWITSYTLHHREGFQVPYSLTVIDTPGFGDTSGIKRDQEITQQIRNFFTTQGDEGIDHIDAIGFVTQASLPRLTPTQRFIFDQVLALFGKDISENIFLLVTFADGQKPPVLEGVKMAEIPYKKYFKFNNSALYAENGMKKRAQYRSKPEMFDSGDDDDGFDEMFWEMGERSFNTFFKNLNNAEAKSLLLTKDVLNERHRLETHVSVIHQHIRTGLNKLEQLRIEVAVLKRHETDIEMNKDFTYTVIEEAVKTEHIPSGTYITNCLTCNVTCHYPCIYSDDKEKRNCDAMDSGVCRICPARCVWNVHKNMTYKFVIQSVTKTKTADELKARYEAASGDKLTAEDLIKKVIDDFESVQLKVLFFTDEVRKSLERLKAIALKPNPLSTVEYIDILIMSEESQKLPGWKDRRQQLVDVRKQAEILQLLAKPGFDPFEEYRKTYFDAKKKGAKEDSIFQIVKKMFKTFL